MYSIRCGWNRLLDDPSSGYHMLVFVILTITCAEIAIVMVYFQLCAEDYRWWWRAFLTSGSCGGYLFLSSVYFFFSHLRMEGFASVVLYFGYMGLLSFVFFVMTGTIGFMATFLFVRYIYGLGLLLHQSNTWGHHSAVSDVSIRDELISNLAVIPTVTHTRFP